ncbi:MAG: translocation/assembly module TamB domain-containing protein [Dysgonamonadaceae bacterium]|jgi:hypothetical protein|nr:translocation/assembly module TamB domain-containing protein [Dysgonamonadaceae bacterium]
MKVLKFIVWIVLAFLLVFYVLPVGLLQVPYVQDKISEKASTVLHNKLGVEVKIGKVDFELFNKLILKDLYLEDQSGDTLFQAKRLGAGFEFFPLLKGRLRFESIQLFSFQLNLNKETINAPLNIQFVLDSFAGRDTAKKDPNIDIQINSLNLRRGNFSYRVKDEFETPGRFNPKDIKVTDLSAKIHLKTLTNKQLIANFQHFAFFEKSGFEVQQLSFDLNANPDSAKIGDLKIKLPDTSLLLKGISADFRDVVHPEDYLSKAFFALQIEPSNIQLRDLKAFLPVFSYFKDALTIEGHLAGNTGHLQLSDFSIHDNNNLQLKANIELSDLTSPVNIHVKGEVEESFLSTESIQKIANNFSNKTVELPPQIFQMGNIYFTGKVSGFFHHLNALGIFKTDIGTVQTDMTVGRDESFFINGRVTSQNLDIKHLMDNNDYGDVSFNVQVNATQGINKKFSGNINAVVDKFEYKGYLYENISMLGTFTPQSFSGKFDLDSREGKINAEGLFVLKNENSEFNFSAEVEHLLLDKLNLSQKYKESDLSFKIKADFTGNSLDNLIGKVDFSDIKFSTEKGGYYLDTFNITANRIENEKLLTLKSDIVNGEIRGIYSFSGIVPAVNRLLHNYLPSIFSPINSKQPENFNNFSIDLSIENTQEFSLIMDLPFVLFNKSRLVGQYNSIYDKFRLEFYSPRFSYGKSVIESVTALAENSGNSIKVDLSGVSLQKNNKKLLFSAVFNALNDYVDTQIKWNRFTQISQIENNSQNKYSGNIAFSSHFLKENKKSPLKTKVNIRETNVTFNDTTWTIHPANIAIDSGKITVDGLRVDHDDQFVRIDGIVSNLPEDNLKIELNKVDLEYVFTTLNIPALEFGGLASGYVNAQDLANTRKLSTELDIRNFAFNSTYFGDMKLSGTWNEEQGGVLMKGHIYKNDSTQVGINGIIYPAKEELSIIFDARNTDASFLRKYLKNIAKDVSGSLNGKLRLFGNLNDPTIEGDVFVKNGRFGIEFLNTYYTFTDTVYCRPEEFIIKNINFIDKNGGEALANGSVKHRLFEDFNYSANLKFNNFLTFNATERQNPNISGTIYGTGTVNIRGTENLVNIDVWMSTDKGSRLSLNFMEENDISNYDFIHFLNKKQDTTSLVEKYFELLSDRPIYMKSNTGTDIRFNMTLDANPDATVELIMDPLTGDKIRMNGRTSNLQVEYGTRVPLKMKGKYTIEQGKYNFSLQQMIFRDFDIREGSSVSFPGDPYAAIFDVKAIFSTMANLGDLHPNLVDYAGRSSVMTNCVLNISGPMAHPNIQFNLEVPESEYIERQIKNYINTEDMMNRQIVYLLLLNRFITPGEFVNTNSQSNDLSLLASTTLSSSLSSIVKSFTDNVQVGTRIRTEDSQAMTGTEIELMLSSQLLDNRLIINGNLGYRDYSRFNEETKGLPPFVGDFDLEYKLTPGGGIRLKAYNHYNYRYYYIDSRSKTTQGLGIIFRKDFDRIDELFGRKKFSIPFLNDTIPADRTNFNSTGNFIRFK